MRPKVETFSVSEAFEYFELENPFVDLIDYYS